MITGTPDSVRPRPAARRLIGPPHQARDDALQRIKRKLEGHLTAATGLQSVPAA
jgi:hypothetical protein